jgi:hypothetical protein
MRMFKDQNYELHCSHGLAAGSIDPVDEASRALARAAWSPHELADMNDKFCSRLHAAIRAGEEMCSTGVSTAPGTKRPIANYRRTD